MRNTERITKHTFVTALEELLEERPLNKITVNDITKHCRVTRRSFYNYFTDINDLILYIHKLADEPLALLYPKTRDARLSFTMFFTYVREHKTFYERAFRQKGYNSFYNSFYTDTLKFNSSYFSEDELTPDVIFALQFYSNGVVFATKQWIKTGMIEGPEVMADRILNCRPSILEKCRSRI